MCESDCVSEYDSRCSWGKVSASLSFAEKNAKLTLVMKLREIVAGNSGNSSQ